LEGAALVIDICVDNTQQVPRLVEVARRRHDSQLSRAAHHHRAARDEQVLAVGKRDFASIQIAIVGRDAESGLDSVNAEELPSEVLSNTTWMEN